MPSLRARNRIRQRPFRKGKPRSEAAKARLRALMTETRKRQIGTASAAYHAFMRSLGRPYPKRAPLSATTRARMRQAKTAEHRAKLSRRMKEIQARKKRVIGKGTVARVNWDASISQQDLLRTN